MTIKVREWSALHPVVVDRQMVEPYGNVDFPSIKIWRKFRKRVLLVPHGRRINWQLERWFNIRPQNRNFMEAVAAVGRTVAIFTSGNFCWRLIQHSHASNILGSNAGNWIFYAYNLKNHSIPETSGKNNNNVLKVLVGKCKALWSTKFSLFTWVTASVEFAWSQSADVEALVKTPSTHKSMKIKLLLIFVEISFFKS